MDTMLQEKDYVTFDDPSVITPLSVLFSGGATSVWVAEYASDEWGTSPEYYFTATETTNITNTLSSGLLNTLPSTSDVTSPVITSTTPSNLSTGTTSVTINFTTNEIAECRYSTTAGIAFNSMTSTFSGTGTQSFGTIVSGLVSGQTYTYYVRCKDNFNNINVVDTAIQFSVAALAVNKCVTVIH